MKEHPILMTTESVKAILDGRKSQSRRVIKPQPSIVDEIFGRQIVTWKPKEDCYYLDRLHKYCPYGQVGDLLWVRETWAVGLGHIIYKVGVNRRGDETNLHLIKEIDKKYPNQWRPSIFMPRWASRIDRIIALLRVERLLDISEADAEAEGGYTIEGFIDVFLKLNHLPEDANPWNWVIGW